MVRFHLWWCIGRANKDKEDALRKLKEAERRHDGVGVLFFSLFRVPLSAKGVFFVTWGSVGDGLYHSREE